MPRSLLFLFICFDLICFVMCAQRGDSEGMFRPLDDIVTAAAQQRLQQLQQLQQHAAKDADVSAVAEEYRILLQCVSAAQLDLICDVRGNIHCFTLVVLVFKTWCYCCVRVCFCFYFCIVTGRSCVQACVCLADDGLLCA